jgi:RNA polymerase sigma factor (sigma-70 family)
MNEQECLTSVTRLYEAYFPQVYRQLYAQFGHHEQAEELAQEVFVKAWRISPPSSTVNLPGWLATIAIRTARDAWRQTRTRPPQQSLDGLLGWLEEVASPLDEAGALHRRLAFRVAWSRLPARQRELLLSRAAGDTLAELARKESCHRSNIIRRLAQARAALRHHYRKAGGEA